MPDDKALPPPDTCAAEYWQAVAERRAPRYVPTRVRLGRAISGEFPIGHRTIASAGDHVCRSNRWGALTVLAGDGRQLGIKPGEFEPLAWRRNKGA